MQTLQLPLKAEYWYTHAPKGYRLKDFTIIRGPDGAWHVYYIKTPDGLPSDCVYGLENMLGHSSTRDFADWTVHDPVLIGLQNTWEHVHLIAPFAFRNGDHYSMWYTGNSRTRARLGLAHSQDLFDWRRDGENPIFDASLLGWLAPGGGGCRDPHMLTRDDRHYLYYTSTLRNGDVCVAAVSSTNLYSWSDEGCVVSAPRYSPLGRPNGTPVQDSSLSWLESSYVGQFGRRWLMLVKYYHAGLKCGHGTLALWSDDPLRFRLEDAFLFIDRAVAFEFMAQRDGAQLFACFVVPEWRFHLLVLRPDGDSIRVEDNLSRETVQHFFACPRP